jgi:hypothetical protein
MEGTGSPGFVPVPITPQGVPHQPAGLDLAKGTHTRGPQLHQQHIEASTSAAPAGAHQMTVLARSLQSMFITPASPSAGAQQSFVRSLDASRGCSSEMLGCYPQLEPAADLRSSQQSSSTGHAGCSSAASTIPHVLSKAVDLKVDLSSAPSHPAASQMAVTSKSNHSMVARHLQVGLRSMKGTQSSKTQATVSSSCMLTTSTLLPPTAKVWLQQVSLGTQIKPGETRPGVGETSSG